jgi:hypothetical protein
MNKWQIGPVKLAKGCDAVIYRFCEIRKLYIGEWQGMCGGFYAAEWNAAGEYTISGIGDPLLNLAPPPKKTMLVRKWLVVHQNGMTSFYFDRQKAIAVEKDIFALIEIDREVTEGEGLQ